ncbi:hypothetical protein EYF80_020874 [Liparis tanakae]|uniref:Uncharacterized protein n=1 Tax=Liparis tanakae TaxID=230148 RepID=A0A4Z2HSR7_9TELE|nr:hypothetical protein EYF80_020874 [Liparis tanakae]
MPASLAIFATDSLTGDASPPLGRSETKALEEGAEEEEQLHSGQTLSETHPVSCKTEKVAAS